ncbi:PRC-barrel domain-containing protein [Paraburkholderia sp. J41]|uniref:PRC-barrel domain-containing protein n=1 Tax=Paraburkholderia sp. J41 TaxID=2805433 RepID=UPI002AC36FC1|nr:PRC-barrel domain-containing protein [Paraburkholderia sp. J41]
MGIAISPQTDAADVGLVGTATLSGARVIASDGKHAGKLEHVMLDVRRGRIAYAVISVGGIAGLGSKLFAVPWRAVMLDVQHNHVLLDVPSDRLKDAPGFDKAHWPAMADPDWERGICEYYGSAPYWGVEDGRVGALPSGSSNMPGPGRGVEP